MPSSACRRPWTNRSAFRAFHPDHAEVHVDAVLRPRVAHHLEDFEDLTEVQFLVSADDVDHPSEMAAVPPVLGGGDVARVVKRCAIGFSEQNRRHFVGGKVHDERALVELRQAELFKPADRVGHQLVVL